VYANSEAIVADHDLTVDNSNWIIAFDGVSMLPDWVEETSNAVHYYGPIIIGNSNSIINLTECCEKISEQVYANSDSIDYYGPIITGNSNSIINLTACCEQISEQVYANSEAIVNLWGLVLYNSMAIIANSLDVILQNSLLIQQNQQGIAANSLSIINNSNAIVANHNAIINNSNAIVELGDNLDTVFAYSIRLDHIETLTQYIIDNSFAINHLTECCEQISEQVYANSEAIVSFSCACDGTGGVGGGCNSELTEAPIGSDISLGRSCFLHPDNVINVVGDATINGNGSVIVFSNTGSPQFVVASNTTVTLENITLKQINAETFDLGTCSKIKIGPNVLFELSEDVVLRTGKFEIIETDGSPTVFTIRGMGGMKRLTFIKSCCGSDMVYRPKRYRDLEENDQCALDLNYHTMVLQNVELAGIKDIKNSEQVIDGSTVIGSISLSGNAIVGIDGTNNLGFVVEGVDNEMRIVKNNVKMGGKLLFGNWSDNILHINAAIPRLLPHPPTVRFEDEFLFVQSSVGRSGVIFDDNDFTVRNLGECSFVVGDHSFLGGFGLEILQNPIKQADDDFEQGTTLVLTSDQPSAIVPTGSTCFRSPILPVPSETPLERLKKYTTALHIKRIHEQVVIDRAVAQRDEVILKQQEIVRQERAQKVVAPSQRSEGEQESKTNQHPGSKRPGRPRPPTRSIGETFRTVLLPETINTVYHNVAKLGRAFGNVLLKQATVTDFGIDLERPLNLTMKHGSTIKQGTGRVTIKTGDVINIMGNNNTIVVRDTFVFNGDLMFAPGSQLLVEFDENAKNPRIIFADSSMLELEASVRLEFRGRGTVIFSDGTMIVCKGTSVADEPALIFNNLVTAECPGQVSLRGIGRLEGYNGAFVHILKDGHLLIGDDYADNLALAFDRLASLRCSGKVSIQKAVASIMFNRSASLLIDDDALFEFNTALGLYNPGVITNVIFDNEAQLKISEQATLSLAENRDGSTIEWSHRDGVIRSVGDGGIVMFVTDLPQLIPFSGKMPDSLTIAKSTVAMGTHSTAAQIVHALVNREPNKQMSTVFVNGDGKKFVRTCHGATILLDPRDVVEEDATGRTKVNGFYV